MNEKSGVMIRFYTKLFPCWSDLKLKKLHLCCFWIQMRLLWGVTYDVQHLALGDIIAIVREKCDTAAQNVVHFFICHPYSALNPSFVVWVILGKIVWCESVYFQLSMNTWATFNNLHSKLYHLCHANTVGVCTDIELNNSYCSLLLTVEIF